MMSAPARRMEMSDSIIADQIEPAVARAAMIMLNRQT